MWDEEKENDLVRLSARVDSLYETHLRWGDIPFAGDYCGHMGGRWTYINTRTDEMVSVVAPLSGSEVPENLRLALRLEYNLLKEKTSGPDWSLFDPTSMK